MTQKNKKSLTAPVSSNPEIACPKTYEFQKRRIATELIHFVDLNPNSRPFWAVA
jgi:hypothetical protein